MPFRVRLPSIIIGLLLSVFYPSAHQPGDGALAGIPDEQRLEVLIRNYDFEVVHRSPVTLGGDTVIILRNHDIVRHGFTSPALPQLFLRVDGEGIGSYGKGTEGLYIDPGKTLVIRLVVEHSGRLVFHCDLHPEMKGELFLLDIPAA
ncbi:MAG: hypothetical protein NW701_05905 [Nitrospira sp.]